MPWEHCHFFFQSHICFQTRDEEKIQKELRNHFLRIGITAQLDPLKPKRTVFQRNIVLTRQKYKTASIGRKPKRPLRQKLFQKH